MNQKQRNRKKKQDTSDFEIPNVGFFYMVFSDKMKMFAPWRAFVFN